MMDQMATISSTTTTCNPHHHHHHHHIKNESTEDIGNLIGDSFSDMTSDDSGTGMSWINKVDSSQFKSMITPVTALVSDHGGYAVTRSYPSPDSGHQISPPLKKDRTSMGSVDMPRDYGAEVAAVTEGFNIVTAATNSNEHQIVPNGPSTTTCLVGKNGGSGPGLVTSTAQGFPKPTYSYSCLIALALKNSKAGRLTVAEIYNFMCENFPYFRSAPAGWKNSVRHNLSLNKCFEKIEVETPGGHGRKSCLWQMNPAKIAKMDNEIRKCKEKDPNGVLESLSHPEDLEIIEKGLKGMPGEYNNSNPYLLHTLPELIQPPSNNHPSAAIIGAPSTAAVNANSPTIPGGNNPSQATMQNQQHQQYLLLRPAPLYNNNNNNNNNNANYSNNQTVHSWTTHELGGVRPGQPGTPPRTASSQPHQAYSTPVTGNRRNQSQASQSQPQSSPFAQTPPYSPNCQIHIRANMGEWAQPNPSTTTPGGLGGPLSHSPYGAVSYPSYTAGNHGGLNGDGGHHGGVGHPQHPQHQQQISPCVIAPYQTAANALNNNSLLQSALAQSPCRHQPSPAQQNQQQQQQQQQTLLTLQTL